MTRFHFPAALFLLVMAFTAPVQAAVPTTALPQAAAAGAATPAAVPVKPPAKDDNPYTVKGVAVDASAETSTKARDKAFVSGQRDAFLELAKKLSGGAPFDIKNLNDGELGKTIKSFEVESERASGTRYVATLTYHFRPEAAAALLSKNGVSVHNDAGGAPGAAATIGGRTLVLPILRNPGRDTLFEQPTSWKRAWENALSDQPNPSLIVPEGNMEDAGSVNASDALAGLRPPLTRIMQKYDAQSVLVASLISPVPEPAPNQTLAIQLARFDKQGVMQGTATLSLYSEAQKTPMEWLQQGASMAIANNHDMAAKYATLAASAPQPAAAIPAVPGYNGPMLQVKVNVPFLSMQEWAGRRSILETIPGMAQLEVLRVNRTRALVGINFAGPQPALDAALAQRGMRILPSPENDGSFIMTGLIPPPPPMFQTVYPTPAPQPAPPPLPSDDE
jgi:hypothetical protein